MLSIDYKYNNFSKIFKSYNLKTVIDLKTNYLAYIELSFK